MPEFAGVREQFHVQDRVLFRFVKLPPNQVTEVPVCLHGLINAANQQAHECTGYCRWEGTWQFYAMNGSNKDVVGAGKLFERSEKALFFFPQSTPFSDAGVACPSSSDGSPISWPLGSLFIELQRTPADEKRRSSLTRWQ